MKHTEEQIKKKALKIMKDLRGKYYSENCVNKAIFEKDEVVFVGKMKGKKIPSWQVSIKSISDHLDFLHISDETGEPLYYQNFNIICFDVEKDKDGIYFKTEI